MAPIAARLFLFLLLSIDYATDTFHGQSPLSQPLGSTENFCHSIKHRDALLKACTPAERSFSGFDVTADAAPSLDPIRLDPLDDPPIFPPGKLVYVLMSLRR